ncbi:MAG: hypothetical protein ABI318_01695, partial [Chthoniobacteraceae bacterium]
MKLWQRRFSTPTRPCRKTLPASALRGIVGALIDQMAHARPSLIQIAFAFAVLFASVVVASACQVPMFRYALERWAPAEYLLS